MEQSPDPLLEWNQLNIANAERGFVRALHVGTLSGSSYVDQFSSWLLAGIGGTVALLVTQVDSVLPHLSEPGFKWCGALLLAAGLFGLLAKTQALLIAIALEQDKVITQEAAPHLEKHGTDEEQIQELASRRGVELDTEIDVQRIVGQFSSALPWYLHETVRDGAEEGVKNPHAHLQKATRRFVYQYSYTLLQVVLFVAFVIVAVVYAAAI
jgi:hypothetical protein